MFEIRLHFGLDLIAVPAHACFVSNMHHVMHFAMLHVNGTLTNCFYISSFTHLKFRNHVTIKTEESADFYPTYLFSSRLSHLEMKLTLTMTALLSILHLHRLLSYPGCVCVRQ